MQSRFLRERCACRGLCEPLEAAQFGFCGEQFCTVLQGSLQARLRAGVVTHSHQSFDEETRKHTIGAATERR